VAAKRLLEARSIAYTEINLDDEPGFRAKLVELTGRFTVPQIFIGEQSIGGFDQLRELDRTGRLADLVGQAA
jgi:glutaredoxin 3